jgi:hypothetical protein
MVWTLCGESTNLVTGQSKLNGVQFGALTTFSIYQAARKGDAKSLSPSKMLGWTPDTENAIAGNESKRALYCGQDYPDPLDNIIVNAHPRKVGGKYSTSWRVLIVPPFNAARFYHSISLGTITFI